MIAEEKVKEYMCYFKTELSGIVLCIVFWQYIVIDYLG